MSAAESEAVIDRLVRVHNDIGPEDFAGYALIAFGILAYQAPEVVTFILDRTDERVTP